MACFPDERFMRIALDLAVGGAGLVSPNPMVGAVIVKDGEVVSTGYHKAFGGPHAEIEALSKLNFDASGSDMYVTLEPCVHYGKTPPCVDAIIDSGISRVAVAVRDPNPVVNGRGIEKLRSSGIEVVEGVLKEDAVRLNRAFFKHVKTGLPYVTLKIASTLDGRIYLDGADRRLSSDKSLVLVHRMRAECGAVLVGKNTAEIDDPVLNVRMVESSCKPVRIVLDSEGSLQGRNLKLFDSSYGSTFWCVGEDISLKGSPPSGVEVISLPRSTDGRLDIHSLLSEIGRRGINSLLVEGGGEIFSEFIYTRLFDEIALFLTPKVFGEGGVLWFKRGLDFGIKLKLIECKRVEDDILLVLNPVENSFKNIV